MRCEEFQDLLAELTDQTPEGERHDLDQHLTGCAECRAYRADLLEIERLTRGLPRDVTPRAELWSGIRAAIDRSTVSPDRAAVLSGFGLGQALRLAAGILLILGATSLAVMRQGDDPLSGAGSPSSKQAQDSVSITDQPISIDVAADLARQEDRVLSTRKDLLGAAARHEGLIDPELESSIEANIEDLNLAIGEIRLALAENPDDSRLSLLLAAKFKQEAGLVKQLNHI